MSHASSAGSLTDWPPPDSGVLHIDATREAIGERGGTDDAGGHGEYGGASTYVQASPCAAY